MTSLSPRCRFPITSPSHVPKSLRLVDPLSQYLPHGLSGLAWRLARFCRKNPCGYLTIGPTGFTPLCLRRCRGRGRNHRAQRDPTVPLSWAAAARRLLPLIIPTIALPQPPDRGGSLGKHRGLWARDSAPVPCPDRALGPPRSAMVLPSMARQAGCRFAACCPFRTPFHGICQNTLRSLRGLTNARKRHIPWLSPSIRGRFHDRLCRLLPRQHR